MGVFGGVTGAADMPSARPEQYIFVRPLDWALAGGRWRWLTGLGAALAVALALLLARQVGFPLDDSWIHQDFARTLASAHQFAYAPGRSGAGSTSPVWVVLLTPPYWLFGASPPLGVLVGWAALLGAASLAALGVLTGACAAELLKGSAASTRVWRLAALLAGLAAVSEWHLVWAAASGMETVLFCALVMTVLLMASRGAASWLLGLLSALAVAVRPEGMALAVVVAGVSLWFAWRQRTDGRDLAWLRVWVRRWAGPFGGALLLGLLPYALLNWRAGGHVLPSTIAAKSAYYAGGGVLSALASYVEQVAVVLLASSPVLVLLGALSYSHRLQQHPSDRSDLGEIAPTPHHERIGPTTTASSALRALLIAWPIVLLLAYAGRLPVLYHNGRYLMPALPPLLALGTAGAVPLLVQWRRPLARVASALVVLAAAFSLVRGAQIYGDNVRFINACQVDTARWLAAHTMPDALIATHDIGAIGYFAHRPIVDIAGLADPQITPFLSDQPRLEAYLKARHASYVVEFTDWFGPPNTLLRDLAGGEVYHARGSTRFVVLRTGW